jgi:DNA (cytosine-5)-methyltransferase 1
MAGLVLSLFPGIGLLDMAFEEAGFCVVRGPDVLWGGDIRRFHPPAGRFDGVIGGPPCQSFSSLARLNIAQGYQPRHGNLIPEYERVVFEAEPAWFVMEEVEAAPVPIVSGYIAKSIMLRDWDCGGETMRARRISFGTRDGRPLPVETQILRPGDPVRAVTGDSRVHTTGHRIRSKGKGGGVLPNTGKSTPIDVMAVQQGLPADFLAECPFTNSAKRRMIGNGVPLPMGRAIAQAVVRAMGGAAWTR